MSDICHKVVGNKKVNYTLSNGGHTFSGYMIKCNYGVVADVDPPAASRNWKNVTCKNCLRRKK